MSFAEVSIPFELKFAWKEDIAKTAISGALQIQEAWGSHRIYFSPITHQDLGSLRERSVGRESGSPQKVRRDNQGRLDKEICSKRPENER